MVGAPALGAIAPDAKLSAPGWAPGPRTAPMGCEPLDEGAMRRWREAAPRLSAEFAGKRLPETREELARELSRQTGCAVYIVDPTLGTGGMGLGPQSRQWRLHSPNGP